LTRFGVAVLVAAAVAIFGFWVWASLLASEPGSVARDAQRPGDGVAFVELDGDAYAFVPDEASDVGFVFYAGGLRRPSASTGRSGPHGLRPGSPVESRGTRSEPGVDGLALWAAFPAAANDLSVLDIDVVSVFGTNDGLVEVEDMLDSGARLPTDTVFEERGDTWRQTRPVRRLRPPERRPRGHDFPGRTARADSGGARPRRDG